MVQECGSVFLARASPLSASHALTGPELEVPGYGCEDHFLEEDTLVKKNRWSEEMQC